MRFLTIAGAAALFMLCAAAPAAACNEPGMYEAMASTTELSAAAKKKPAPKKEKVEYMRSAS